VREDDQILLAQIRLPPLRHVRDALRRRFRAAVVINFGGGNAAAAKARPENKGDKREREKYPLPKRETKYHHWSHLPRPSGGRSSSSSVLLLFAKKCFGRFYPLENTNVTHRPRGLSFSFSFSLCVVEIRFRADIKKKV